MSAPTEPMLPQSDVANYVRRLSEMRPELLGELPACPLTEAHLSAGDECAERR